MRRVGGYSRTIGILCLWAACNQSNHTPGACDGPCPQTQIRHLVVLVQENHTFDNYFGRYCKGQNAPTCNDGPGCCEAGPAMDPSGAPPVVLDDTSNAKHGPMNSRDCEVDAMDGGKMDRYVTGMCGDPGNFAYADETVIQPYWQLAQSGALADRFFQPIPGASSANDMFLTVTKRVFDDNNYGPGAIGSECSFITQTMNVSAPTVNDLLTDKSVSWAWYIDGYDVMKAARAKGMCPDPPDQCGFGLSVFPCVYDPADIPAQYEVRFRDDPKYFHDYSQLQRDLDAGKLPQVVFVKPIGWKSEHPGLGDKLTPGIGFASDVIGRVKSSAYGTDTLILLTYDEGGGYFDHVSPPPSVDADPYGTRVPLLATGPFARTNWVSHVTMEHSSVIKFIEWNWLGATGQLDARDALVANLGSMLDPKLNVPEN